LGLIGLIGLSLLASSVKKGEAGSELLLLNQQALCISFDIFLSFADKLVHIVNFSPTKEV
jgi:hypothetical protein